MRAGPVVLDNTPLVALWALGRLDLLQALFDEVAIPPAVHQEFLARTPKERRAALDAAPWIRVEQLGDPRRALRHSDLGPGEAEVLALAEERRARLVVVDELRARRHAERSGFPLTGTVGILLLAKERGLVVSVASEMRRLREAGLYLGDALLARAAELAGE